MKKVISRVLGVILSLLMAFYCLDLTAFAEGLPDTQENETEVVAEIETIEETTDVEDAEDEPETVFDEERAETDADEAIEETEVLEDSDDLVEDQEEIADLEEETQEETVDSQEEDIVSEEAETPDELGTSEDEACEEIKASEETDTKEEDIKDALTEEISEENSDITEVIVIEPEEIYSVEDINNDEVLSDYIGSKVNPKNTVFYSGTMAGNKLSGVNKQMYDKAKDLFARVADGEEAYCVCELKFSELGIDTNKLYSASELGVSSVKDGNGLSEEATAALKKKFGLDKYSSKEVFGAVLRDCPYERYWMGLQISGSGIGYRYTSDGSAMGFYGESLLLYFWPSEDYAGSKDFYVDTNKTKAVAQTIKYNNR